tara:strand:+ start:553 stop:1668 length:1116 start_codon:yes stop_codon:yes gene_type:complete
MSKTYDFTVIGAGISACTFSSFLNNRFSDASIILIEQGRRVGGRATTRKSRKNKNLEFDHGLPSFSLSDNISKDILTFIAPLIDAKKLLDISNDILTIDELGYIKPTSHHQKTFRSVPSMINFCQEIIYQSNNPQKIDFLFQAQAKSIKRINNLWQVEINDKRLIKSKNLILSSSLIAHPRCLEIMKINSLPLSDAFVPGEDKIIDSVLREIKKQKYIMRKTYILHVSDFAVVQKFDHQYLQICFSKIIKEDLNFERIIFQIQSNGSLIIVLHTSYLNHLVDLDFNNIIKSLTSIFINYKIFLDLFSQARLIDTMSWRASQPFNYLLPKHLQWSSKSHIGFCGDWFDSSGIIGVESAMNSSIRLSKLLDWI